MGKYKKTSTQIEEKIAADEKAKIEKFDNLQENMVKRVDATAETQKEAVEKTNKKAGVQNGLLGKKVDQVLDWTANLQDDQKAFNSYLMKGQGLVQADNADTENHISGNQRAMQGELKDFYKNGVDNMDDFLDESEEAVHELFDGFYANHQDFLKQAAYDQKQQDKAFGKDMKSIDKSESKTQKTLDKELRTTNKEAASTDKALERQAQRFGTDTETIKQDLFTFEKLAEDSGVSLKDKMGELLGGIDSAEQAQHGASETTLGQISDGDAQALSTLMSTGTNVIDSSGERIGEKVTGEQNDQNLAGQGLTEVKHNLAQKEDHFDGEAADGQQALTNLDNDIIAGGNAVSTELKESNDGINSMESGAAANQQSELDAFDQVKQSEQSSMYQALADSNKDLSSEGTADVDAAASQASQVEGQAAGAGRCAAYIL